jgi:hypothetical protein
MKLQINLNGFVGDNFIDFVSVEEKSAFFGGKKRNEKFEIADRDAVEEGGFVTFDNAVCFEDEGESGGEGRESVEIGNPGEDGNAVNGIQPDDVDLGVGEGVREKTTTLRVCTKEINKRFHLVG